MGCYKFLNAVLRSFKMPFFWLYATRNSCHICFFTGLSGQFQKSSSVEYSGTP